MHELYRVSRRPYLIAARPPDLAFNFLRTDYGIRAVINSYQLRRDLDCCLLDKRIDSDPPPRPESANGHETIAPSRYHNEQGIYHATASAYSVSPVLSVPDCPRGLHDYIESGADLYRASQLHRWSGRI